MRGLVPVSAAGRVASPAAPGWSCCVLAAGSGDRQGQALGGSGTSLLRPLLSAWIFHRASAERGGDSMGISSAQLRRGKRWRGMSHAGGQDRGRYKGAWRHLCQQEKGEGQPLEAGKEQAGSASLPAPRPPAMPTLPVGTACPRPCRPSCVCLQGGGSQPPFTTLGEAHCRPSLPTSPLRCHVAGACLRWGGRRVKWMA